MLVLSNNTFGSLARSVVKLKKRSFSWKINLEQSSALLVNCLHLIYGLRALEQLKRAPTSPGSSPFFYLFLLFLLSKLAWPPFFLFFFFIFFCCPRSGLAGCEVQEEDRGAHSLRGCAPPSRSLASDNWALSCTDRGCNLSWTWLQSASVCVTSGQLVVRSSYEPLLAGVWPPCQVRPVVSEEMFNWAQSGQESAKPNLWKEQRGATERFSDVGGRSWDEASNNVTSEGRPAKGVNSPLCEVGSRQFIFGRASNTSSPRANNLGIRTNMTQPTI